MKNGNWALESLPIFPDRYDFEVAKDKGKQFKIVAVLLKKATTIIVATDSDREGENIAWSIIHKAHAFSEEKIYKRLWINSSEKDVIRSGFQNLQLGLNYYPFYQEAQTRQLLIGMNASPFIHAKFTAKGGTRNFLIRTCSNTNALYDLPTPKNHREFKKRTFF